MENNNEVQSEMEVESKETKVTDSAYSNSCTNSNSQTSASSKSAISGSSSSRSSGYCGNDESDVLQSLQNQSSKHGKKNKKHKSKLKNNPSHITTDKISTATSNISYQHNTNPAQEQSLEYGHATSLLSKSINVLSELDKKFQDASIDKKEENNKELDATLKNKVLTTTKRKDNFRNDHFENISTRNIERPRDDGKNIDDSQNGFCCIISMINGLVQYTTPSLTTILGFPKGTWLGRNFADFIHPNDKEIFYKEIITGVTVPFINGLQQRKDPTNSIYIYLKKYNQIKCSAYNIRRTSYQAFNITTTFRRAGEYNLGTSDTFLFIVAVPVYASFKVPDDRSKSNKFAMHHTAGCILSYVDADVVTNLGYLPQDMLGKSVFDFYHPEDLPFLKEIYESVISKCQVTGTVYKSKPYRFAVHNGDFAMIETEWSSFVNPWSRRLELIIGLHRILQGPGNPDVFEEPDDNHMKHVSDSVLKTAEITREQILSLLSQEFHNVDSVIPCEKTSPRNSDAKEPSEPLPSYLQLNYNENIVRFFNSKPVTIVASNGNETNQDTKNLTTVKTGSAENCLSPLLISGASGSDSGGVLSCSSNLAASGSSASNLDCYKPQPLTEELLHRHNEDMEKIMRRRYINQQSMMAVENKTNAKITNGVKRTGTHLENCNNCKVPRHSNTGNNCDSYKPNRPKKNTAPSFVGMGTVHPYSGKLSGKAKIGVDKSESVVTSLPNAATDDFNAVRSQDVFPFYYVTSPFHHNLIQTTINHPVRVPVHYMPDICCNYNSAFTPLLYAPVPVLPVPVPPTILRSADKIPAPFNVPANTVPKFKGPASQATSVKAEPGSVIGSVKSASVANRTTSHCSHREFVIPTLCSPGSPQVGHCDCDNHDVRKIPDTNKENLLETNNEKGQYDSSSNSSFPSSFFKADTNCSGSASCDDKSRTASNATYKKPYLGRKSDPPWMYGVSTNFDIMYNYQMSTKNIEEILQSDRKALQHMEQPMLVNDQLEHLYFELEVKGLATVLEEDLTSFSGSEECNIIQILKRQKGSNHLVQ